MGLEKINIMRKSIGMSIDELSDKSGVPKGTVSKITSGITKDPGIETVKAIVYAMGFRLDDLDGTNGAQIANNNNAKLSKNEYIIIQKYRDLDDHGKRMVDIVIKEETSRMESERQDDVLQIPLFDLPASAGFGLPLEGDYRTIIEAPDTPLNRKADFCIRVAGDSMEPDYSDGDIVLVKKSEVYIGDIGIFVLDGESYIKELGKDVLISRNPKYNDIPLPDYDRIMVAGKVIGKL